MIKYRRLIPQSTHWFDTSYETLDKVLYNYPNTKSVNCEVLTQSKISLKLKSKSILFNSNGGYSYIDEVWEYWDDKFPFEEPESELPDWLK